MNGLNGSEQLGQGGQALVQGLVGGALVGAVSGQERIDRRRRVRGCRLLLLAAPEAAPAAAHVPVGERVDEPLQHGGGGLGTPRFERRGDVANRLLQFRSDPPVQLGELRDLGVAAVDGHRLPAVDVGVVDEEGVDVPDRNVELAPHLVARGVAEVQVVGRGVAQVHPAHHVDAHLVGGILEPDGVALALVHLGAVLVAQQGIAEARLERLGLLQRGAHRQQ